MNTSSARLLFNCLCNHSIQNKLQVVCLVLTLINVLLFHKQGHTMYRLYCYIYLEATSEEPVLVVPGVLGDEKVNILNKIFHPFDCEISRSLSLVTSC